MAMRRAAKEGMAFLRQQSRLLDQTKREFSSLPEDLAEAARKAKFPPRRHARPPPPLSSTSPIAAQASSAPLEMAKEGARIASSWMFPWERRQMEGTGGLRTWEKAYWGVFVVAIAVFLFNRASDWTSSKRKNTEEEEASQEEIARQLEQRREERSRGLGAGATVLVGWGEEDVFDGMSPQDIQAFVEKATGMNVKDPYDGMDPGEIDEYVRKHGELKS